MARMWKAGGGVGLIVARMRRAGGRVDSRIMVMTMVMVMVMMMMMMMMMVMIMINLMRMLMFNDNMDNDDDCGDRHGDDSNAATGDDDGDNDDDADDDGDDDGGDDDDGASRRFRSWFEVFAFAFAACLFEVSSNSSSDCISPLFLFTQRKNSHAEQQRALFFHSR